MSEYKNVCFALEGLLSRFRPDSTKCKMPGCDSKRTYTNGYTIVCHNGHAVTDNFDEKEYLTSTPIRKKLFNMIENHVESFMEE